MPVPADDPRIPVVVLTGFLGSGKTTLLRRLLADPRMSRAAVLINEFGEIALDHLLVKSVVDGAVVLQNGCICCTLRTDLRDGITSMIDGRYAGKFPEFDHTVDRSDAPQSGVPREHRDRGGRNLRRRAVGYPRRVAAAGCRCRSFGNYQDGYDRRTTSAGAQIRLVAA
jgi:hypothetical protein